MLKLFMQSFFHNFSLSLLLQVEKSLCKENTNSGRRINHACSIYSDEKHDQSKHYVANTIVHIESKLTSTYKEKSCNDVHHSLVKDILLVDQRILPLMFVNTVD